MGYKKHVAWKQAGDYFESYLCVCPRQMDHRVPMVNAVPDLELFTLTPDGEMAP